MSKKQKYLHVFKDIKTGDVRFQTTWGDRLSWRVCIEDYLGKIKIEEVEDEEADGFSSPQEMADQVTSKAMQ
jgi:hypothetical protein